MRDGIAIVVATLLSLTCAQGVDNAEVDAIFNKMKTDVLALRDEYEARYAQRCSLQTLQDCKESSYSDCGSSFPNPECMEANIPACGGGSGCSVVWDKTVSKVSIPAAAMGPGVSPVGEELTETVCYTHKTTDFMADMFRRDTEFWRRWETEPLWTYFGAHNGLSRFFPANQMETCGAFDPRVRPWYVAASSGPKDVVLVIDVSGSMENYGRLSLAKAATRKVIETLTVADRVAVVWFNSQAQHLPPDASSPHALMRATKENKDRLLKAVDSLRSGGGTNFAAGFTEAFDLLEATIERESTTGCNIAVLFLTDGESDAGGATAIVQSRRDLLQTKYGRQSYIFTYSLGSNADTAGPKQIACETGGLWAHVADGGNLVGAMSSYYKLFALGLGEGDNRNFFAVVEPYADYATGVFVTTFSAPVYDRSVSPPLFLGVVGVDPPVAALEQILGESATSSAMLSRFVELSTAVCPRLQLTECELDALRLLGGGQGATCGRCGSVAGIVPAKCPGVSDLPRSVWANTDHFGESFAARACCKKGSSGLDAQCASPALTGAGGSDDGGGSDGTIIAVICSLIVVAAVLGAVLVHRRLSPRPVAAQFRDVGSHELAQPLAPPLPSAPPLGA